MRPTIFRSTLLGFFIIQFTIFSLAQVPRESSPQATGLEIGKPFARELKGGEAHSYSLNIKAGQFAGIVVDQRGIDVVVTLFAPDRTKIAEVDSPNGPRGAEAVTFVAKTTGTYVLEVRSLDKMTAAGHYGIRLESVRDSNAEDLKAERTMVLALSLAAAKTQEEGIAILTAESDLVTVELAKRLNLLGQKQRGSPALITHRLALAVAEKTGSGEVIADSLYNIGNAYRTVENFKNAAAYFRKSLEIFRANGNSLLSARTLNDLGNVHRAEGQFRQALEAFQECLKYREALPDKGAKVRAMLNVGFAHRSLGEFSPALDIYQKALSLSEEIGDKALIAQTLFNLGIYHRVQSNFEDALDFFKRELKLREELANKQPIAVAHFNIGFTYRFQSEYELALESLQRALKINGEINEKMGIAEALRVIGDVFRLQGNYAKALDYLHQSLQLLEGLRNKQALSSVLHLIGIVHKLQGNNALAMSYYEKDLKLREEIGSTSLIADTLSTMGTIHLENKHYENAAGHFQRSFSLQEQAGSKRGMAIAAANLGEVLLKQGKYAAAMDAYRNALKIGEAIEDRSVIGSMLTSIGELYRLQGYYSKALDYAQRGATVAKLIGEHDTLWNAKVTLGLTHRAQNDLDKARGSFEEAIEVVERLLSNISGQQARASYFATVQKPYEHYVDVLMQQHRADSTRGHDALALQVKERARARSLLEALSETEGDITQGVDGPLLERERNFRQKLNALAERQTRMLLGKHSEEKAKSLQGEIVAVAADLQLVEAQIRQKSPRYIALTKPVALTALNIQNELLDADTVVLEYALGDERSYFWSVTRDSLKSYELPGRSEIDTAARRVYELLQNGKRWTQDDKISVEYADASAKLSEMVLGPVAEQVKGKRLVIVADGALQYVPFSALPRPKGKHTAGQTKTVFEPMAVGNEIVSLPSASTLAVLRREAANRKRAGNGVAIVADPVFSDTDERLANARVIAPKGSSPAKPDLSRMLLERAFSFNGEAGETFSIPRLPFTRREADSIFANAPKASSFKALDFEASRDAVMGRDLSQYRIVHFATHGILHSEHPELSGIVLSLVNEKGEPVNGFLRLNEIYNMNLNADLVVLSACQTALGKEVRGEGLIGLTRGFMYAGSPRVVASLWKVDDVATAELMKIFYQKMLKEKMRPAAALRAAKIAMMKQKRWNAPFYWAAFELQGEWR